MSRPSRAIPALLFLLAMFTASSAAAQSGVVAGRAVQADDGQPIAASLVRLLPAAGGPSRTALTEADGTFRFADVAPGTYRLAMERIGYTADPSPPFAVAAGQTAQQTLRATLRPVVLTGISTTDDQCYTADRLARRPDLEALWREAQKGAETRRAFQSRFAFRYNVRVTGEASVALFGRRDGEADRVQTWHPDSLARLEAEARERMSGRGYARQSGEGLSLSVPNEIELLSDGFLTRYCLENVERDREGLWAFRFRPVRVREGVSDIRGVLRLEPETFRVRELDYEYLAGGRPWGRARVRYADVATPMGPVRMPVTGRLQGRPVGGLGLVVRGFEGELELRNYRSFVDVRGS